VNKLGRVGTQVIVPYRKGEDESIRHLKVMGDIGQIVPMPFNGRDMESIKQAVQRSDVVINCLGKQELTGKFDFFGSNVEAVTNIAKMSKEAGVPKFIHVSALAADEYSPSEWLRRKAQGELAVREEYPDAVILRTSIMFGDEDLFLNSMAKWAKFFGVVPLVGRGDNLIQPVYVDNVAEAVRCAVLEDEGELAGKLVELAGPRTMSVREVGQLVAELVATEDDSFSVRSVLPDATAYLPESSADLSPHKWAAKALDGLYRSYPISLPGLPQLPLVRGDSDAVFAVPWVAKPGKHLQLADMGIAATDIKTIAPEMLHRYRRGGHFLGVKGERYIPL